MARAKITAKVKNIRAVSLRIRGLDKAARRDLREAIIDASLSIQKKAKQNVDSANVRRSIKRQVARGLGAVVFSDFPSAKDIEFGTGVFNVQSRARYRPPVSNERRRKPRRLADDDLIHWVGRHISGQNNLRVAYAVAESIFKKGGTEREEFLIPALEEERAKFRSRVLRILRRNAFRKFGTI